MIPRTLFLTTLSALVGVVSPAWSETPSQRVVDGVVAIVDTEPITRFELYRAMAPFVAKAMSSGEDVNAALPRLREEVLDNLVTDLLVLGEARKLELTARPEQVQAQLDRVRDANGWDDAELEEAITASGFNSIAAYRKQLERDLIKTQIVSIRIGSKVQIGTEEVQRVYETEFGGGASIDERRALHILIRIPQTGAVAAEAAATATLLEAREAITSGSLSFEDAARRYSQDGNAAAGGDLGWFSRGTYDPIFEEAVFGLPLETVSAPIRTPFGLHLIRVVEVRTRSDVDEDKKTKIMQEIRYRLRAQEVERLYAQWVDGLRARAYVEIRRDSSH